jgi:hypothetical protein
MAQVLAEHLKTVSDT